MNPRRAEIDPALQSELLETIDRFKGTPILVVGDLIVDHYIWGRVERISPEAPVVVVQVTREEWRLGGAGNVIRNLTSLGAQVSACGVIGDDEAGRQLAELLEQEGSNRSGLVIEPDRPTTIKTRVIAHSQQVVRIDREDIRPIASPAAEELSKKIQPHLSTAKGVILSDYAKGVICENVYQPLASLFAQQSARMPVLVDPKAPNFALYRGVTVIKPNRKEAEQAAQMPISSRADALRAAEKLRQEWASHMVLITLGEDGMVLVQEGGAGEREVVIDTVAREVFDVSGAGDTVSAVFLLSLSVGARPRVAAMLANYAAGLVVAEVGTVAVDLEELRETVREGRA